MKFPDKFLWGSSTASHQVEGGNTNNWSEWEKKNAQRLAAEFPNSFPLLHPDPALKSMGKDPQNYISGSAVDHYNLYEKDFDLMKSLNLNSYRFSIEWSRIEPEKGKIVRKEIDHYIELVAQLRIRGIEPVVTIWHWTHPVWVEHEGGILGKNFLSYYLNFVDLITSEIVDVKYWLTINEPEAVASMGYFYGEWPPQKKGFLNMARCYLALMKCHREGFKIIKRNNPKALVSFAHHRVVFEAFDNSLFTKLSVWFLTFLGNDIPFLLAGKKLDYIALNHYGRSRIKGLGVNIQNENKVLSDIGWEVLPRSIYSALVSLKKYGLPILITENGVADGKDRIRGWMITETLEWLGKAIEEGVNVIGYLHWSFMDNFEWDKGYWPKFGLVEVNRKTMERKVRPSAYVYSKIVKENAVESI